MSFGGAVKLTGESEYRRALSQITQNLKELSSEMKLVTATYDKNDKSAEALAAKSDALTRKYNEQTKKVTLLKSQYSELGAKFDEQSRKHEALLSSYEEEKRKLDSLAKTLGTTSKEYKDQENKVRQLAEEVRSSTKAQDANEKAMSEMRIEINKAQTECQKTAKELDNLGNAAEESGKDAKKGGEGFTVFKAVIADLASKAIQSAINGLKKLGGAIIDVGKQAYNNFASYEQLVGGVETLFADSGKKVEKYAAEAYKTAGISANEYMEQATSFAAVLIQGLEGDTEKAADYADLAIRDMSDNANKMGTSIDMIQSAYSGLTRGIYSTFDNLKLGYGGTAGEVARLINDTKVLGDGVEVTAETVKEVPFNKIIEAIHKVQQNLGITGTTAKEAAGTLEGSSKSVKASWENLTVAIADENADLRGRLKIFTNNVVTLAKNAVPRIKQIVKGLGDAIVQLLKTYAPKFSKQILPVIEKVGEAVKSLVKLVVENSQTILSVVSGVVAAFIAFKIGKLISDLAGNFIDLFKKIKDGTELVKAFNTTLGANPYVLVATLIAGIVTALITFKTAVGDATDAVDENTRKLEESREEIADNKKAWEDLKDAQQKYIDKGMSELSFYETLYDELKTITDENGKVKEGYEERASFIVTTLKDALGVEIEYIDGVIKKYGEVREAIDKVMEKKKAQIILDSQEKLYQEALEGQSGAYEKILDFQGKIANNNAKILKLEKERDEVENAIDTGAMAGTTEWRNYIINHNKEIRKLKADNEGYNKSIKTQENLLKEYFYNIGVYEKNMAAAHAGNYDAMTTVAWSFVSDLADAENAEEAILEKRLAAEKMHLATLEELNASSADKIYTTQINAAKKQISELEDQLKQYQKVVATEWEKGKVTWRENLDDDISVLTGRKVEFRKIAFGFVQTYIDGVAQGGPMTKAAVVKLINGALAEAKTLDKTAKGTGRDLIEGINAGIQDPEKQKGVFSSISAFGVSLLERLRASLKEKSPSKATKEMGQYLIEGLELGIDSEERGALKKVGSLGKAILGTFNAAVSGKTELGSIASRIPAKVGDFSATSKNNRANPAAESASMVSAFKEALGQVKIVLDDEIAGEFVEKTVTKVVYA